MMGSISSYGKVQQLGHRLVRDLEDSWVIVQEKVDGSQFSFGLFDGELQFRSKNMKVHPPGGMFADAVQSITDINAKFGLRPDFIYRGEYLQKPKHNVLHYQRTPVGTVILFDIEAGKPGWFVDDAQLTIEAQRLGMESVPQLMAGPYRTVVSRLDELIDRESILGGPKIEGIVIKNRALFGPDGKMLMSKYVRPEFKEIANKDWKDRNPTKKDVIQSLIEELATEPRWTKAVQALRDQGRLTHGPKDIGPLIAEVQRDIADEAADHIKHRLYRAFIGDIQRGVIRGLPEWYKELLLLDIE